MSRRVWIAQCLCPQRHCIMASIDEAADQAEAEDKISKPLREQVAKAVADNTVNPWCGICQAPRETWHFELGRTRWTNMAEAMPEIEKNAAAQALTGAVFGQLLGAKTPETRH
jgi:hypothetical protein